MPALWLLKLFGFWSTLKRGITSGVSWLMASTTHLLIALCAVLALWGGWERHRASKWHRIATSAINAAAAQRRAYDAASAANARALAAQNQAWEAKSTKLAKDADNAETELRARAGALNVAYADRMRADKVCIGPAPGPGQTDLAKGGIRPGSDAVLVGRADYNILTGNTLRLQAVHDWAAALVKDGLAQ